MENSLSIQEILRQKEKYNLAIPFVAESQRINPYYRVNTSLIYANTDLNAGDIFKVGSRSLGNNRWEDLYSLTKTFLQRLATGAGIKFAPGFGDVVKMDENTWKSSAFGSLRLPDGDMRTCNDFKVIDLVTEERKYRLAYEEKAVSGITDPKAAKDAARKYSGQWQNGVYIIAEQDRRKYIENSLLDAMAKLRCDAPQKASTGAILRVIRNLIGIKGAYTIEELKKPFAVARMSFAPDYNDPMIKQMMLQQCIQSVGNLFGNVQPVMQTFSIPRSMDVEEEIDMPVDPMYGSENDVSQQVAQRTSAPAQNYQPDPPVQEQPEDRTRDFCCDKCGVVIPRKVWDYSYENFGRPLCYKCQKIIRGQQGGGYR